MSTSTSPNQSAAHEPRPPLTVPLIRELWSKTYNDLGKPDWSHILPYYAPDVVFQDTVQRVEGIEAFTAMCHRLTKRCQKLIMRIRSIAQEGNDVFMEWEMIMQFRRSPTTSLYGTTRLTLNDEGRIVQQRDYYDLWGDIFNNVPGWRRVYRKALVRFFG